MSNTTSVTRAMCLDARHVCLSRVLSHTLTRTVRFTGVSALPLTSFPGSPSLDQFSFQTWLKVPEDKSAQAQSLGLKLTLCRAQML